MSGIITGGEARLPAHLISLWRVSSPPLGHPLSKSLLSASQTPWCGAAGHWRRRRAVEACLKKGSSQWVQKMSIITVSDRLEHVSIQRLLGAPRQFHASVSGKSRTAAALPSDSSRTMERKEGSFSTRWGRHCSLVTLISLSLSLSLTLSLSPLNGWATPGPRLSVLSETVGAVWTVWLPDAVTVWSGVIWRQRRVIATCPGRKSDQPGTH